MNTQQNFEALDVLALASFALQLQNINKDNEQTDFIQKVIQAIAIEVGKLHKENDIIIKQNDEILMLLNNRGYR